MSCDIPTDRVPLLIEWAAAASLMWKLERSLLKTRFLCSARAVKCRTFKLRLREGIYLSMTCIYLAKPAAAVAHRYFLQGPTKVRGALSIHRIPSLGNPIKLAYFSQTLYLGNMYDILQ